MIKYGLIAAPFLRPGYIRQSREGECLADILRTSNHLQVMSITHISSLTTCCQNVTTRNRHRPSLHHNFCKHYNFNPPWFTFWSLLLHYRSHHPRCATSICASSSRPPFHYRSHRTRSSKTLGKAWRKSRIEWDPKVPQYARQTLSIRL